MPSAAHEVGNDGIVVERETDLDPRVGTPTGHAFARRRGRWAGLREKERLSISRTLNAAPAQLGRAHHPSEVRAHGGERNVSAWEGRRNSVTTEGCQSDGGSG